MDGPIRHDDELDPLFVEDLRTAFPETTLPQHVAEDHIAAMVGAIQLLADKGGSALEPTSNAYGPERRASGLPKLRRRMMKRKLVARLAVAMAMLLSLAGLANAGMLPDQIERPIANILGFDSDDADDQGEDADDQGEDTDVDGDEVEHGGLVGVDDEDADDQGEDGDDQGEDGDDQGEDADDQGEDADDQGEDADDQGEDADDQGEDETDVDDEGDDSQSDDGEQDGGDDSQ